MTTTHTTEQAMTKLTEKQIATLEYIKKHDDGWGCDCIDPDRASADVLEDLGLVRMLRGTNEDCPGWRGWRMTDAGRSAL
jgi:hypothetical protein